MASCHNLYDSPSPYSPANQEIHFLGHQEDHQHPVVVLETSLVENEVLFRLEGKQELAQTVVHNDHNLLDLDEIFFYLACDDFCLCLDDNQTLNQDLVGADNYQIYLSCGQH